MKNPDKIIIRNKLYPNGLKEIDIFNYYQKNRQQLIEELKGRDIALVLMPETNKSIIKRKINNKPITLNNSNYDSILNGVTTTLFGIMKSNESFGIIDIDIDDNFRLAKKATNDIYEYVMDKIPIIQKVDIKYTGKHSFHLIVHFNKSLKIESIKNILTLSLKNKYLMSKYTLQKKRIKGVVNIDLSSNKFNGGYICKHSLSRWGLKCMDVEYNDLLNFKKISAKI